ncbi:AAA family ATPase [Algoriphagus lutimaris]|uniref:AAA family ATPase n=1 Tax=Algoriphagus lutimaris TaxID=613197 RepID=UPI00196A69D6|nr:AAA family ATPase [Algoriphagus lutimaris]MBN3519318.1 AAA family ATPase [Algoriphagus lutimaris]
MITKITLNGVASYKKPASLETDMKVNLVYGLNGTGKSTFSDYLYKQAEQDFKACSIEGLNSDEEIIVYNQSFVQDNFFQPDALKGIFTLSKENKEAKTKILNAEKEIKRLDAEKIQKTADLKKESDAISLKHEKAKDKVWEIKKNYTGGDRVLEFCLEGYRNDGKKLLSYIESLKKPDSKPTKTTDQIKEEVQALSGENAQKYILLDPIDFDVADIETELIFKKEIVGNENSTVSGLINKLENSDWVKDGLKYLPTKLETKNETCPFCQEQTISSQLLQSIKEYFDESYEADLAALKEFRRQYAEAIQLIPDKSTYDSNPKFENHKKDFEIKYNVFTKVATENLQLIDDKIKTPSVQITLKSSVAFLTAINGIIENINKQVKEHNKKIDQKETALLDLKTDFWNIMRWEYDQTLSSYISDKAQYQKKIAGLNQAIEKLDTDIQKQREIIVIQQKQTVNIEEAIANINNGLLELGIHDFKIKQHADNLYKIVREQNDNKVFLSLSEGEKMIISFLYFLELCRGKKDATEAAKKKIIVIDDPISSLSHIYVFNVGRLIKNEFFGKKEKKNGITTWNYKYEQVFILTHSLYFFYEITETKHDERKETQKLFRLIKNDVGSYFEKLTYESIKNDYQAYWYVIKDQNQHPALIANCMRNIIEYFFNFIENKDLNNFFNQPTMQEIRFQAFYRYINRESHSLGQNIFDFKEFNYQDFKDAFSELFKVAGYEEHYKKMIS